MTAMFRGIRSGLFADAGFGCLGALLTTLLVAGAMLGLVAMAWWAR